MEQFEWDDRKAEINFSKHRVQFSEAATVWCDDNSLEMPDLLHVLGEDRWIRLGYSRNAQLLVVVYVVFESLNRIRIISARKATTNEQKFYHRGQYER